ncbi:Bacterial cellulose synthase subunit [Opitutaceae bacterium TAV5]|nr:Bacterial cellulose synthase subunit [Opitutaceae bacterium TAV5]
MKIAAHAFVLLAAFPLAAPAEILLPLLEDVPARSAATPLPVDAAAANAPVPARTLDEVPASGWQPWQPVAAPAPVAPAPAVPVADAPVITGLRPAAPAPVTPPATAADSRPRTLNTWQVALSDLLPSAASSPADLVRIDLTPLKPVRKLTFQLSPRDLPQTATLTLAWNHSRLLQQSGARLEIRLNGILVGQPAFAAAGEDAPAAITSRLTLPGRLFRPGANTLLFTFAGLPAKLPATSSAQVSAPGIQIEAGRSILAVTAAAPEAPRMLDELSAWLAPRPGEPFPLHIAIPQSSPLDDALLTAGAIATQGVVLRLPGNARYHLTFSPRLRRAQDNLLIGTFAQILPFLPEDAAPLPYQGPVIALHHLPGDPSAALVVITGPSEQDVITAAAAFAAAGFPLPSAPATLATLPENYPDRSRPAAAPIPDLTATTAPADTGGGRGSRFLRFFRDVDSPPAGPVVMPPVFVRLLDGDPRTVVSMWDIISQAARREHHALIHLQASFNPPPADIAGSVLHIEVGLLSQWTPAQRERHPLRLAADGAVEYTDRLPAAATTAPGRKPPLLSWLIKRQPEAPRARPTLTWRVPAVDFTDAALMLADPDPSLPPAIILAAIDPGRLQIAVEHLQTAPLDWFDSPARRLLVWSPATPLPCLASASPDESATDAAVAPAASSPRGPATDAAASPIRPTVVIALAVLVFIGALALITNRVLRRAQKKTRVRTLAT